MSEDRLRLDALDYHRSPVPGKLAVVASKPLATQRDLSLAYSPGVAAACEAIAGDPGAAAELTARANLVAVVTNGTAVLGLGAVGPLAAKPVMEGKAVLFKKFAGIDAFDIEVDARDVDRFVEIVAALEPTFGAINLEDIKAPECFEIERRLQERMRIPVFHDDQHGTAIIVAAALLNALELVGKRLEDIRLVTSGAGAAALACLELLAKLGLRREQVIATDIEGVVYEGRERLMDPWKARWAARTEHRTLAQAIRGADVLLGLSAPRVVTPEMVASMADKPIVFALANPVPEIMPEDVKAVRPDAIVATGRSDYPNQVNNVLCFPFIFRGALDVGATRIDEAMRIACVHALARLAREPTPETVTAAYGQEQLAFGPDYLIPKPFDPRLIVELPVAVAEAAMKSGVATRPIRDLAGYRARLQERAYKSGFLMRPLFERARAHPQRLVYTDGEEERVLRAVQVVVEEGLARPILIGRPEVVANRIRRFGLRLEPGRDFELCNPDSDPRYNDYVAFYQKRMGRSGVTPEVAREVVRTRRTVIAAIMVARGEADAMLAGPVGRFLAHLRHVLDVLGLRPEMREASAVHGLVLDRGGLFIADTSVSEDPSPEQIASTAVHAAEIVRGFGLVPKVALVSHSNFGSRDTASARKMREALAILRRIAPELEVDGEMQADTALSETIRRRLLPDSTLSGEANLLIMPSLDAASAAYNLVKAVTEAVTIGPILIGPRMPAHILNASVTARGIVNMSAVACVDALARKQAEGA
ncbi:MAG: NADP-dependent malic enzyme [Geminicoccaceae bacterium]|nr:NADP-dependent malic enzyme [Geminicoccaceae bacterium]MCS7267862.1 NADP-dependent malic enzyme [Geminicoccaceae bacterium]MCX7630001.1 NADP-dependent malic enzyme [Geminicoccaceae bacterium]MDW8124515.1 NADP-dependent malic enzyme [Geminicoccaceae bacterium]MDW8341357.1 NADP-dependent malic enzyme [Geminicoccaceae bacterium]